MVRVHPGASIKKGEIMPLFACQVCQAVFARVEGRGHEVSSELVDRGWSMVLVGRKFKWACKACQKDIEAELKRRANERS